MSGGSIPDFHLPVESEETVAISKRLLCLKFHLQESYLLLEREVFDEGRTLIHTVYQKPIKLEGGPIYNVDASSYTIIGGVSSFDMSQASTLMPESGASLERKTTRVLRRMLPPVKESEPLEFLSSDDDDN